MERNKGFSRLGLILSYVIFGSVGIFVRFIALPSSLIAAVRGLVGAVFILIYKLLTKSRLDREGIRKNLLLLIISGAAIGFNWIFLFEAYRYTSIATATLCYYMAPVFVTLAAPFVLREKFSAVKGIGLAVALVGMVFASGVLTAEAGSSVGIAFGLAAALLYATAIICNRKMSPLESTDRALLQLAVAGAVVIPYVFAAEDLRELSAGAVGIALLLAVSLIHTGLAYVLNLGAVGRLPAQTVAIMSYIDPITAIAAAAVIFGEIPDVFGIMGAVLVLGGAFIGEIKVK